MFDCDGRTVRALVTSSVCAEKQASSMTDVDVLETKNEFSVSFLEKKYFCGI